MENRCGGNRQRPHTHPVDALIPHMGPQVDSGPGNSTDPTIKATAPISSWLSVLIWKVEPKRRRWTHTQTGRSRHRDHLCKASSKGLARGKQKLPSWRPGPDSPATPGRVGVGEPRANTTSAPGRGSPSTCPQPSCLYLSPTRKYWSHSLDKYLSRAGRLRVQK